MAREIKGLKGAWEYDQELARKKAKAARPKTYETRMGGKKVRVTVPEDPDPTEVMIEAIQDNLSPAAVATIIAYLQPVRVKDKGVQREVEWFSELEAEWTMKPHYYFANYRFYNYPYVYAQLFVYALYEKYLQEGGEFVPKFKKALSVGSSVSPAEIGRIVGLDVTDPGFWELGFKRFEHFLTELERVSVSSSWK